MDIINGNIRISTLYILCDNSTKANMYANTLMPILGNLGNLVYVIVAIIGGILSIKFKSISINFKI